MKPYTRESFIYRLSLERAIHVSDLSIIERLTVAVVCAFCTTGCAGSEGNSDGEMRVSVLEAAVREYDPSPMHPRLVVNRDALISVGGLSERELHMLAELLEGVASIGVAATDSACVSERPGPLGGCMEMAVRHFEKRDHDTTAVRVAWYGVTVGGEPVQGGDSYQATLIVGVTDGEARVVRREEIDYAGSGVQSRFPE
ncbi:MAG: hypothetical protein P8X82_04940 [Gemmatimonadales bacterium]